MKNKNLGVYIGILASMLILCVVCVAGGYIVYVKWDQKTSELKAEQAQVVQLQRELEDSKQQISGLNQETASLKSDHDALQSQLTELKDKLAQLKTDYETLSGSDAQAVKDLEAAKDTNQGMQNDIETANAAFASLSDQMKKAAGYAGLTDLIIGPLYKESGAHDMTDFQTGVLIAEAQEFLDIINDPVLSDKFDAMIASGYDDTEEFDFYLYLLDSMESVAE
jgi:uncharacterized membrane protein